MSLTRRKKTEEKKRNQTKTYTHLSITMMYIQVSARWYLHVQCVSRFLMVDETRAFKTINKFAYLLVDTLFLPKLHYISMRIDIRISNLRCYKNLIVRVWLTIAVISPFSHWRTVGIFLFIPNVLKFVETCDWSAR